jgi:fatty acid desaturase
LSGLIRHCFSHLYEFERQFIPQNKRPRVFFEARVILSIYAALFIASLLLQSWFLAIYWLLPRLMGEPFMRMARLSEHQGCPLVPDLLRNTRTVIAALPIKYLGWYACYHAEHHLSPNTPFHAVRKLHKKIAGEIVHIETGYLKIHGKIFADARAGRLPRG